MRFLTLFLCQTVFLAGCRYGTDDRQAQIENLVRKPVGLHPDYWLEIRGNFNRDNWYPIGLFYANDGSVGDIGFCESTAEALNAKHGQGEFRCTPANQSQ